MKSMILLTASLFSFAANAVIVPVGTVICNHAFQLDKLHAAQLLNQSIVINKLYSNGDCVVATKQYDDFEIETYGTIVKLNREVNGVVYKGYANANDLLYREKK